MAWLLVDDGGRAYRVPDSISPTQLHVGGSPKQRFVRGYGSETWYVTQDGLREPAPLELSGTIFTDRDEAAILPLIEEFDAAVNTAARLVQIDVNRVRIRELPLLGGLPIITVPDGVDGTLLRVTARVLPDGDGWQMPTPSPKHFSNAFNSAFNGGLGSPQEW